MTAFLRALLLTLLCATTGFGQSFDGLTDDSQTNAVSPSLVADTTAVVPGKPFTVLVRLKMAEAWHIYWQFEGDIGTPTKVNWQLPEGFTAGPIQWPLPTMHVQDDMTMYGYEEEVSLPVQITPPAQISASEVALKANVSWLVCKESCVPGDAEITIPLPVGQQATEANADLFAAARNQLPKTEAPTFRPTWDVKPQVVTISVSGLEKDANVEFFPLPSAGAKPGVAKVSGPDDQGTRVITIPVKSGGTASTPWQGLLVKKLSDSRSGWMISSSPSVQAAKPSAEVSANNSTGSPDAGASSSASSSAPASEHGLLGWLGLAFVGGLILNLMPCVLPVISLKIFSFVSQAGEDPKRVFRLGLAFTAGVFVFFLGLAAIAIFLGEKFSWGMQFDPKVLIVLISLVVVFALSMFGVFEITLGGMENAMGNATRKEGYTGAFVHGMFTTLLGTSCTAPILGSVLGFVSTQKPAVIVLTFALMAAGMSLPYFLLTLHPKWLRFLPKPGMWMERFKQVMGFVLLAVAIWLLSVLGTRGAGAMSAAISFVAVVAFGTWIYGVSHRRWWALLLAIGLCIGGGKLFLPTVLAEPKAKDLAEVKPNEFGITWQPYSDDQLKAALAKNQPVFIDFTADWCINCKYNENHILDTAAVSEAFKTKNVLTLQADWTSRSNELLQRMKKYGRVGVPVYVLYRPGEEKPVILPELLTQKTVTDELAKIRNGDVAKAK